MLTIFVFINVVVIIGKKKGNIRNGVKVAISLSLPKWCNYTPRNIHERFQTLLTPVLTIFTDFLSAVVTSEIAQILSLYGGGFLALKWQS